MHIIFPNEHTVQGYLGREPRVLKLGCPGQGCQGCQGCQGQEQGQGQDQDGRFYKWWNQVGEIANLRWHSQNV